MKLLIENWRQYLIEQVASPLTVEFDGHQNEHDQTTYFFKVNGHEIEILVTQLYDPEQVAEYLAIEIEDASRVSIVTMKRKLLQLQSKLTHRSFM